MTTPSDFARYVGLAVGAGIFCLILIGSMWFLASTTPAYWVAVVVTGVVLLGGLVRIKDPRVRLLMMVTVALHFVLTITAGVALLLEGEPLRNLWIVVPVAIFDLVAFSYQRR